MKKRNGLVMMLCALLMSGTMFACASDSGDDNNNNEPNGEQTAKMQATPASLSLKSDATADFAVSYTINGEKAQGGTLFAQSGNTKCFTIDEDTKEQVTIKGQDTVFTVVAKDVTEACNGMVNIIDKNNLAEAVQVSVSVSPDGNGGGGGTVAKDPEFNLVEPGSGQIKLDKVDDTDIIIVEYLNAKGKPQAGTYINVYSSMPSCVTTSASTTDDLVETTADGEAKVTVKAKGSDCTSNIILTVVDADEVEPIEVTASVGEPDEYFLKSLQINYLNADSNDPSFIGNRHNEVKKVYYGINSGDRCPTDSEILEGTAKFSGTPDKASTFNDHNPFIKQRNYKLSRAKGEVQLLAIAYDSSDNILAGGCVDGIDSSKAAEDVVLNMHEAPIYFADEYEVITNFNLLSQFVKTPGVGYTAEYMASGDWVQFAIAFCRDPFGTLVDFVWDNTLLRLANLKGDKGEYVLPDWIRNSLGSESTKKLALAALQGALEPKLKEQTWYNVIDNVADDIQDLASNLQLKGQFVTGDYKNLEMSNMTISFDSLQYQWSLVSLTGREGCLDEVYGNSDCRRSVSIVRKDVKTIEGTCNPTITLSQDTGIDGYMEFHVDNLTFKWASILYNTIFGEILPLALDYYNDDDLKKKQLYIKAFLNKILFTPVVNFYKEKVDTPTGEQDSNGNDIKYPNVSTGKPCEDFVTAIVYLVLPSLNASWLNNTTVTSVVPTAAGMICSDGVIGQLDETVAGAFTKIEASTSQGLSMKTKDCGLYSVYNVSNGRYEYKYIGKPDAGTVPTATDVFGDAHESTDRCIWDVGIGESFSFKGIFHGEDNAL